MQAARLWQAADHRMCIFPPRPWFLWENRDFAGATPGGVLNTIYNQYPGIKLGNSWFFDVYVAAMALEALGFASEVEDPNAMQRALCRIRSIPSDGAEGVTQEQYEAIGYAIKQQAYEEFPKFSYPVTNASMVTLWVAAMEAIGAGDARDITTAVLDVGQNCACPGDVFDDDAPTDPLESGYYLGTNLAGSLVQMTPDDYWRVWGVRNTAASDVYGVLVQLSSRPSGTQKRAAWDGANLGVTVEQSLWSNTSDHMENDGFHDGAAMVYFADAAIAEALAGQLPTVQSHFLMDSGDLGTVLADSGVLLGACFNSLPNLPEIELVQFRWIHKQG